MKNALDWLPAETGHTRPHPWTDQHSRLKGVSSLAGRKSVFVIRSTNQTSMAQGLFYGSRCRAVVQTRPEAPKCLRPCQHSPKKARLSCQATNLAPPRWVRAWETASWRSRTPVKANLDRLPGEPGHTWPDPCTDQHRWPRCVPAQCREEVCRTSHWPKECGTKTFLVSSGTGL